jgi:hypothetical protein
MDQFIASRQDALTVSQKMLSMGFQTMFRILAKISTYVRVPL